MGKNQKGSPRQSLLNIEYRPAKNQRIHRIHQQHFNPSGTAVKSVKLRGSRMTTKSIKYIDMVSDCWWDFEAQLQKEVSFN